MKSGKTGYTHGYSFKKRKELPVEEKIAAMELLADWFKQHKRSFPWRNTQVDRTILPYRIWVSEVMLQQTRAEVVEPFFIAWMKRFPTLEQLAKAEIQEVIKAWEGLGYYSRAKRLWLSAKHLVEHNDGRIPDNYEELLKIQGFGPYTAGAVMSFAFQRKAAAVDGNVARVIARLFAIEEEIDHAKVQKQIRELTFLLLPDKEPWVVMEALIELGALICRKNPDCTHCPLKGVCDAQRCKMAAILPRKKEKKKMERIEREVALLVYEKEVLITQVAQDKVMAGLYEFPYFPKDGKPIGEKVKEGDIAKDFEIFILLDSVQHTFTRFHVHLYPYLLKCAEKKVPALYHWHPIERLRDLPFSSGHRKLIQPLEEIIEKSS